jgi:hypothetical protein
MNPDVAPLLTPEQRAQLAAAGRTAGLVTLTAVLLVLFAFHRARRN